MSTQNLTPAEQTSVTNFQQPPLPPTESVKPAQKWPLIIISILLVIVTSAAAYFYFVPQQTTSKPTASATPSPVATVIPTPTASTDPTAEWKTYTNKTHNYTLKYQPSDQLKQISCPKYDQQGGDDERFIIYTQIDKTSNSDPSNQCNSQGEDHIITILSSKNTNICKTTESWKNVKTLITIDGVSATQCKSTFVAKKLYLGPNEKTVVTIPSNNQYITILLNDSEHKETFNQILSTFKFTDQIQKKINNIGTVNGKLCYPSDFLPPGEIVAKNISTGQITSKPFSGSMNNIQYSIKLPAGTYNIRYQAHASSNKPNLYTSFYYTSCGLDNRYDNCIKSNSYDLLPINVISGQVISNINLCSSGSDEQDEQLLEKSF